MKDKETNYLTPLNAACDMLRDGKDDLAMICRALHLVGNAKLADRLARVSEDMNGAIKKISEGRDVALSRHVYGAEQASRNMVEMAMASVRPADDE